MLFLPFQSAVKLTYTRSNFQFFSGWNPGRRQVPPKAKSQLRHWVQTWPLVGLTHGFDMSWFQNKTGAKSESETLGAAEQYSLLKADGVEAVFPNVEVALYASTSPWWSVTALERDRSPAWSFWKLQTGHPYRKTSGIVSRWWALNPTYYNKFTSLMS